MMKPTTNKTRADMNESNNAAVPGYTPELLEGLGYDAATDYTDELNQYNAAVRDHNKPAAVELLRRHGGLIALCAKCGYQQQKNNQLKPVEI